MGARASRGWWWSAALLGACSPNAGAVGGGGANTLGVPDTGETTAGTTEDGPASTSTATTASVDSTSGTPDDTTGPVDGSTTEAPPAAARLMISDGPRYDFGDVPSGGQAQHVFTVTNTGDGDAQGLAGAVDGPFAFPGGFPGDAGSCGDTLAAGADCLVELVFAPAELGRHAGELAVSHDGGEATRALAGGAAGQTDNLLVNPGGEDFGTPPPGWTAALGDWSAGVEILEADPFLDMGYLYSDEGDNNVDLALRQDVDVAAWASTIDAGLLRIAFTGRARGLLLEEDEHRIRVHFFDEAGGPLGLYTSDYQTTATWTERSVTRLAPAGTRTIRVELNCRKDSGSICNAYFDALDLTASYP